MSKNVLEKILNDNQKANIWQSKNIIIKKIFERDEEMQKVYQHLDKNLTENQQSAFWDGVLGEAAFRRPEDAKELQDQKRELENINCDIVHQAQKLSNLMLKRYELSEESGLSAYDAFHIVDYIENAASDGDVQTSYMYDSHIKNDLRLMSVQYDCKYWPKIHEVIAAIGKATKMVKVQALSPEQEIMLSYQKKSPTIYIHNIIEMIEDLKKYGADDYLLPVNFHSPDAIFADLVNVTLDLQNNELLGSDSVKGARQRIRKKAL